MQGFWGLCGSPQFHEWKIPDFTPVFLPALTTLVLFRYLRLLDSRVPGPRRVPDQLGGKASAISIIGRFH
jgi:hypothetical protein